MKSNYLEKKFNEKLEKSSKLFTMLGLVLALFVIHVFMEYETEKMKIDIKGTVDLTEKNIDYTSEVFKKEVIQKKVVKIEEPKIQKEIKSLDKLKIVEDTTKDIIESLIKEDDPFEEIVDINAITEVDIVDPIEEDVPFISIEEVPVFPGCKGTKAQLKACFAKKMKKHVNRKFNTGLSETLGLSPGVKRISVQFTIDKDGKATNIKTRAPHPKLEKEAIRIIKLLPTMTPGKQRHKPVRVKYTMPISFKVE